MIEQLCYFFLRELFGLECSQFLDLRVLQHAVHVERHEVFVRLHKLVIFLLGLVEFYSELNST